MTHTQRIGAWELANQALAILSSGSPPNHFKMSGDPQGQMTVRWGAYRGKEKLLVLAQLTESCSANSIGSSPYCAAGVHIAYAQGVAKVFNTQSVFLVLLRADASSLRNDPLVHIFTNIKPCFM